jgi:hypothetical protein
MLNPTVRIFCRLSIIFVALDFTLDTFTDMKRSILGPSFQSTHSNVLMQEMKLISSIFTMTQQPETAIYIFIIDYETTYMQYMM